MGDRFHQNDYMHCEILNKNSFEEVIAQCGLPWKICSYYVVRNYYRGQYCHQWSPYCSVTPWNLLFLSVQHPLNVLSILPPLEAVEVESRGPQLSYDQPLQKSCLRLSGFSSPDLSRLTSQSPGLHVVTRDQSSLFTAEYYSILHTYHMACVIISWWTPGLFPFIYMANVSVFGHYQTSGRRKSRKIYARRSELPLCSMEKTRTFTNSSHVAWDTTSEISG